MASTKSNAVIVLVAFLLGALLSGLTVMSLGEGGPKDAGQTPPVPDAAAERAEIRRTPALPVGDGGVNANALGGPASEEELEFLRTALGAERERRRKQAQDAALRARETAVRPGDNGLEIMRRYLEFDADVSAVVADYASMRSHIRTAPGPLRRFAAEGEKTKVELSKIGDGFAVLEFGPGEFVLDSTSTSWNVPRSPVESLEIRGAGMDRTRLVGPGWAFLCASEGGPIRNLLIRDLTIDGVTGDGQIVLDARDGISAALERVRIDGWVVAGHASAMGVSGNAFLACRDCEFNAPGDGWVLSLRGPALARFDRCRFVDARGVLIASPGKWRPAVVRLSDCTFDNTPLTDRKLGALVEVTGGKVVMGATSWTEERRLAEFKGSFASSITGLTFTSIPPRFTMVDALRAMEFAASSGLGRVIRLDVRATPRDAPVRLDLYVPGGKVGATAVRHIRLYDKGALSESEEATTDGPRGVQSITAAEFERVLPLRDLFARARVAPDESVSSISLRAMNAAGGEQRTLMWLVELVGNGRVGLDAVTGKELYRR